MVARHARYEDTRCATAAIEHIVYAECALSNGIHPRKGLAQTNNYARHATVTHNHIGPKAQRHDRNRRIEPAQKVLQVIKILRLKQPFCHAARLEPDKRRQRRIGRQLSANRRQGERCRQVRAALMASARPAAHLVMSPAPRHTTMSPGLPCSATTAASAAASAISAAA